MASPTPEISDEPDILYDIGQACVEHLEACMDAEFLDLQESNDSPAFALFCGCNVCVVREVLMVAYPLLQLHFEGNNDSA
jgi:hypothetical protein